MNLLDLVLVKQFVHNNIENFYRAQLVKIQKLRLSEVLRRKNPYLFRVKNPTSVFEFVESILEATMSSSEEGRFGHFLEDLAIFVAGLTCDGRKSSTKGIDLEFSDNGIRYLVTIKSGPNWGNKDQHDALRVNFRNALKVLRQSSHVGDVRAVLGTCYGKNKTADNGEYLTICGQSFWHFLSNDPMLYTKIFEMVDYEVRAQSNTYQSVKEQTRERLIRELEHDFCDEAGQIDWIKMLEYNSGNL